MFTVEERDRVRALLVGAARDDPRIVSAAEVGSLALGDGDRWSDLDLAFGVAPEEAVSEVVDEWARRLVETFDAVQLFDLQSGPGLYRVFFLPGCLQIDLSFWPASQFRATSPRFRLLFGEAESVPAPEADAGHLLGYAVMFAWAARVCVERERWWQAEYCISNMRYYALSLACRRRDLPSSWGKGFDRLPSPVVESWRPALATSLDREELLRALACGVEALGREIDDDPGIDPKIGIRLGEIVGAAV